MTIIIIMMTNNAGLGCGQIKSTPMSTAGGPPSSGLRTVPN